MPFFVKFEDLCVLIGVISVFSSFGHFVFTIDLVGINLHFACIECGSVKSVVIVEVPNNTFRVLNRPMLIVYFFNGRLIIIDELLALTGGRLYCHDCLFGTFLSIYFQTYYVPSKGFVGSTAIRPKGTGLTLTHVLEVMDDGNDTCTIDT